MLSLRLPQDKPLEQFENMPLFEPVLQTLHPHKRDKYLQFEPNGTNIPSQMINIPNTPV